LGQSARITYEIFPFPHLPIGKVVGLGKLIKSNWQGLFPFTTQNIWKVLWGAVFFRDGKALVCQRAIWIELTDINAEAVASHTNSMPKK